MSAPRIIADKHDFNCCSLLVRMGVRGVRDGIIAAREGLLAIITVAAREMSAKRDDNNLAAVIMRFDRPARQRPSRPGDEK